MMNWVDNIFNFSFHWGKILRRSSNFLSQVFSFLILETWESQVTTVFVPFHLKYFFLLVRCFIHLVFSSISTIDLHSVIPPEFSSTRRAKLANISELSVLHLVGQTLYCSLNISQGGLCFCCQLLSRWEFSWSCIQWASCARATSTCCGRLWCIHREESIACSIVVES